MSTELKKTYQAVYDSFMKWCNLKEIETPKPNDAVLFIKDLSNGWPRFKIPKDASFINRRVNRLSTALEVHNPRFKVPKEELQNLVESLRKKVE